MRHTALKLVIAILLGLLLPGSGLFIYKRWLAGICWFISLSCTVIASIFFKEAREPGLYLFTFVVGTTAWLISLIHTIVVSTKKQCPKCMGYIPGRATRCYRCQSDLTV